MTCWGNWWWWTCLNVWSHDWRCPPSSSCLYCRSCLPANQSCHSGFCFADLHLRGCLLCCKVPAYGQHGPLKWWTFFMMSQTGLFFISHPPLLCFRRDTKEEGEGTHLRKSHATKLTSAKKRKKCTSDFHVYFRLGPHNPQAIAAFSLDNRSGRFQNIFFTMWTHFKSLDNTRSFSANVTFNDL